MSLTSIDSKELWKLCLSGIKRKIHEDSFETWFGKTKLVLFDRDQLVLEVPNQFFADWLEEHYLETILTTVENISSFKPNIVFKTFEETALPDNVNLDVQLSPEEKTVFPHTGTDSFTIDSRYTFESFVVGNSNQFAYAASLAVSESPGVSHFNPLVIYGGTGLGKTHILRAIVHTASEKSNVQKIVYTTSEEFTSEFILAIKNKNLGAFSNVYRNCNLLLVDDIQFFNNKERTQEEFFHTFNALHHNGKQIVLTMDKPPNELQGLQERLISRFQWGLVTDIQPPDFETRVAIIKKKAEQDNIQLPDEVAHFIAEHVTTNIRELEGTLIKILFHCSVHNQEMNLDLAKVALRNIIQSVPRYLSIDAIQRIVSNKYDIPNDHLIGESRKKEIAFARHVAMYLSKELTKSSLKTIGLHFGGRDHSTVIHAIKLMSKQIEENPEFSSEVQSLIHEARNL